MSDYVSDVVMRIWYKVDRGRGDVRHALLMRLQYTRYPFETVCEWVVHFLPSSYVRDHQTRCPLIQYELPRLDNLRQLLQQALNHARVRDQEIDNLRPSLIQ